MGVALSKSFCLWLDQDVGQKKAREDWTQRPFIYRLHKLVWTVSGKGVWIIFFNNFYKHLKDLHLFPTWLFLWVITWLKLLKHIFHQIHLSVVGLLIGFTIYRKLIVIVVSVNTISFAKDSLNCNKLYFISITMHLYCATPHLDTYIWLKIMEEYI